MSYAHMALEEESAQRPSDPLLGRVIDERYRIEAPIGQGGMGVVYAARHEILGARLAVKILRAEVWGDEEALARLKREAQTASAIGHRHIVDVRDFGRLHDGSPYVVMERIDGDDLLRVIRESGKLPWVRARRIALQICAALQAAHEAGVVHRDLKPENVLLTVRGGESDFVKIVDFGIARVAGGAKITQAGRVVGTPEYMSPEQCAGREVDARADVYALGVLLYEMSTGRLPFQSDDVVELVRMHMQRPPTPPSRHVSGLPIGFEAVILRCLAKRPAKRFRSMNEVAEALRAVERAPLETPPATDLEEAAPMLPEPATARPSATPTPVPAPAPPPERDPPWRRYVAAALAVSAAVAGAAFGVLVLAMETAPEADAAPDPGAPVDEADDEVPAGVGPPLGAPASREADEVADDGDPARDPAPDPEPPRPAPETAEIEVTTEPAGAEVYEGGAFVGNTPHRVVRPRGEERLRLTLRADGYHEREVVLGVFTSPTLNVPLERRPRPGTSSQASSDAPAATSGPPGSSGRRRPFLDPWAR